MVLAVVPLVISTARLGGGDSASDRNSGAVSGKVVVTASDALPEMIVFLEAADAEKKFEVDASQAVAVSQRGALFDPSLVVIAAGQTVEFVNDESRPIEHNVFSRSPAKQFDLGLYRPGAKGKKVTFEKPGPVRIFCSIHRYMDGVVYVCPTPFFAKVGADGSYEIANVPAGNYRVKTWQRSPRYSEQDAPLAVKAEPMTLNLTLSRK